MRKKSAQGREGAGGRPDEEHRVAAAVVRSSLTQCHQGDVPGAGQRLPRGFSPPRREQASPGAPARLQVSAQAQQLQPPHKHKRSTDCKSRAGHPSVREEKGDIPRARPAPVAGSLIQALAQGSSDGVSFCWQR